MYNTYIQYLLNCDQLFIGWQTSFTFTTNISNEVIQLLRPYKMDHKLKKKKEKRGKKKGKEIKRKDKRKNRRRIHIPCC